LRKVDRFNQAEAEACWHFSAQRFDDAVLDDLS